MGRISVQAVPPAERSRVKPLMIHSVPISSLSFLLCGEDRINEHIVFVMAQWLLSQEVFKECGCAITVFEDIIQGGVIDHWDTENDFVVNLIHRFGHLSFHVCQADGKVCVVEHADRSGAIAEVTISGHLIVSKIEMAAPGFYQSVMVNFAGIPNDGPVNFVEHGNISRSIFDGPDDQIRLERDDFGLSTPLVNGEL